MKLIFLVFRLALRCEFERDLRDGVVTGFSDVRRQVRFFAHYAWQAVFVEVLTQQQNELAGKHFSVLRLTRRSIADRAVLID